MSAIQRRILAAAFLLAADATHAAEPAKTEAGLKLAQQYCSECHVVVPSQSRGWTDAPAFDAVAKQPGQTAAKLLAFIEKPHMHMLNTGRPPNEAADVAAYIMSLRKN